jgi:hypothetical protein
MLFCAKLRNRDCDQLLLLLAYHGQLQLLQDLKIADRGYVEFPAESTALLPKLEFVIIQDCKSLSDLPEAVGELKSLRQQTLEGCGVLKALPERRWGLPCLQHLVMKGFESLEELPPRLSGQFPALAEPTILESFSLNLLSGSVEAPQALPQHYAAASSLMSCISAFFFCELDYWPGNAIYVFSSSQPVGNWGCIRQCDSALWCMLSLGALAVFL